MPTLIAITAIAVAVAAVFSPGHIALTAAITGVLGLLILRWRLRSLAVGESIVIALIVAASVLMWRLSANMPQLNSDGLPGFSANDVLCPVVTYVVLGLYAAARPPTDTARWAQARALVTLAALVVTVVTIWGSVTEAAVKCKAIGACAGTWY